MSQKPRPRRTPAPPPVAARLRECAGAPLFMLVDAARDAQILPALGAIEEQVEIACLWQGEAAATLADVAPYLIAIPAGGQADEFVARAWGRSWGVFAATASPLAELRRHLRRFALARLPGGEVLHFRLYDPRVLRGFLPTCPAPQRAALFAGLDAFLIEDAAGTAMRCFRPGADGALLQQATPAQAGHPETSR